MRLGGSLALILGCLAGHLAVMGRQREAPQLRLFEVGQQHS